MHAAHGSRLRILVVATVLSSSPLWGFDSGSTGEDGNFNPTVDTRLQVPADGIFNFTSIDIPSNVTVTFENNAVNTPLTILVGRDANVAGVIDVSGGDSPAIGGKGDGNLADDGLPGMPGPGGFAGGPGGDTATDETARRAQHGLGSGGGKARPIGDLIDIRDGIRGCSGTGGGYGHQAESNSAAGCDTLQGGSAYGSELLLPLIGGSGGGGGTAGASLPGSGGGGGGGAIVLAVTGTLKINGAIRADGGASGATVSTDGGGNGGGGSGGGIRLIATTLAGDGPITARGGSGKRGDGVGGGDGAGGRIRLEADTMTRTAATEPPFTAGAPGPVFLAGLPNLRIASVAGVDAPSEPTGDDDIVLPADTPNPVEVAFETSNVPLGKTVVLTVTPRIGEPITVTSTGLDGTESNATATASIAIPDGPNTLLASVSFTVTETQSKQLSYYTDGEPVDRINLASSAAGGKRTVLITESGREVTLPARPQ